jgi:thioesterase domain-containing protein
LNLPDVKEAAVVLTTFQNGDPSLTAYYTSQNAMEDSELRTRLNAALPAYMVPAHFHYLETMPLTSNGKVDRAALMKLVQQKTDRTTTFDSTASGTEAALTSIWEEVLDRKPVEVYDNFFALGGHSLLALKLTYLIHQRLGVSIPFTLIFKAPTVREMARCVINAARFGESAIDDLLVCLTPGRQGKAVFAFPPGTADALGYSQLAQKINGNSFYAFNFMHSDNVLNTYADLIETVDPEGPYVLFGYSGGGNIAFRTAAVLESRNKVVSAIIMLDSSRFLCPYRFPASEAQRLADQFLASDSVGAYAPTQVLKDKVRKTIEHYYDFLSGSADDNVVNATIHVIVSERSPEEFRDETGRLVCSKSAWAEGTRAQVQFLKGHGEHGQMLHALFLDANVALIERALGPGQP